MEKKNNRISVKDYLQDKDLLKFKKYIPYSKKVNIIDSIMKEVCRNMNGLYSIDSVLLDRIKKQIFIEQLTNLNLSIIDNETGLDGYDLLYYTDAIKDIDLLISSEFMELDRLLKLRINDYLRDKTTLKGFLNYKTDHVLNYIDLKLPELIESINKIDIKSIIDNFATALDKINVKNIKSLNNKK